jgi:membrane protein YdbS with pleckstrin-like domain
MHLDPEEKFVFSACSSRRSYWLMYLLAIFFTGALFYFWIFDVDVTSTVKWTIFGFLVLSIKTPEVFRRQTRIVVTTKKIIFTEGIFHKNVSNALLPSVFNVDVIQTPLQRLLNCGDLVLGSMAAQKIVVKDLSRPHERMSQIESLLKDHHLRDDQMDPSKAGALGGLKDIRARVRDVQ